MDDASQGLGERVTRLYLGCSGWHYDQWLGIVYSSRGHYLEQYAQVFSTVEVNSTFYHFPKENQLKEWYNATPDDFIFSVKLNHYITHTKRLRKISQPLQDFVTVCKHLGHKLGPFLVGLPPSFKKDVDRLDMFLSLLPEQRLAFEFRHESWFSNDVLDRFRNQNNLVLVTLGAHFDKNVYLPQDFSYIRWRLRRGNQETYSSEELDYWVRQIREFLTRGDVFGYWNHDVSGPLNCLELADKLNI